MLPLSTMGALVWCLLATTPFLPSPVHAQTTAGTASPDPLDTLSHSKFFGRKSGGLGIKKNSKISTASVASELIVTVANPADIPSITAKVLAVGSKFGVKSNNIKVKGASKISNTVHIKLANAAAVEEILNDPRVVQAQRNYVYKISAPLSVAAVTSKTRPAGPGWGWDRATQRATTLDGSAVWPGNGTGVDVYVVDTGINASHSDFQTATKTSRVSAGYFYPLQVSETVPPLTTSTDEQGHGSHVAGTIGGNTYGGARGVNLIPVRVLGADGTGSTASVLGGLDWILTRASGSSVRSIINMSVGGPDDPILKSAVARLVSAGLVVVVAAGNEMDDACFTTPANVPDAITVGAISQGDLWAPFSNYGTCVDILAPGVAIWSVNSKGGFMQADGTSMATPHVTAAAAILWSLNPSASSSQVTDTVLSSATTKTMDPDNMPLDTTDRILYIGVGPCEGNPCKNGGNCSVIPPGDQFSCSCSRNFTGQTCEININNPCLVNPCKNSGRCYADRTLSNGLFCRCVNGFGGDFCQIPNPCASSPCGQDGVCKPIANSLAGYVCECSPGYLGSDCSVRDPCKTANNPCQNDGVCKTLAEPGQYVCQCPEGFFGADCENQVQNPCIQNPDQCQNGGVCVATTDGVPVCVCDDGFGGHACEIPISKTPESCASPEGRSANVNQPEPCNGKCEEFNATIKANDIVQVGNTFQIPAGEKKLYTLYWQGPPLTSLAIFGGKTENTMDFHGFSSVPNGTTFSIEEISSCLGEGIYQLIGIGWPDSEQYEGGPIRIFQQPLSSAASCTN